MAIQNCVEISNDCFEIPIDCPDLDPWPETDVDDLVKGKRELSWYGWY